MNSANLASLAMLLEMFATVVSVMSLELILRSLTVTGSLEIAIACPMWLARAVTRMIKKHFSYAPQ